MVCLKKQRYCIIIIAFMYDSIRNLKSVQLPFEDENSVSCICITRTGDKYFTI